MTSCLLLAASCGARITGSAEPGGQDAAVVDDAAMQDGGVDALTLGPWSSPATIAAAATTAQEDDVTLSANALEMIFAVVGANGKDLYYTSRATLGAAWSPIAKLPFDGTASEESPRFSGDDLTLYFASDRTTAGDLDIYSVTRTATGNTSWGTPALVRGVNSGAVEKWLAPCAAGRYVVVRGTTDTGTDLREGTLGGAAPVAIAALNSASNETAPFLTQDCLAIYFASNRSTQVRIYVSHRPAIGQPWDPPAVVADFKIAGDDNQEDPWLSADGRTFVFASDARGSKDVYLSTR